MDKESKAKPTKRKGPHGAAYMAGRNSKVIGKMLDQMREIPFPNGKKVLEVGGIIGALPFKIADELHNEVTLAYQDPIWLEMAKVFPTIPVTFVEAAPTRLDKLQGQDFDLVLLLPGELRTFFGLPDSVTSPLHAYLDSAEGKALLDQTKAILARVKGILSSSGKIIIVESLSTTGLYALAKAFEESKFYLDYPEALALLRLKNEFSALSFSQSKFSPYIPDIPLAAAIKMGLEYDYMFFSGAAAESLRNLFAGASILRTLDYEDADPDLEATCHEDILEKEGFALIYRTSSQGDKEAELMSAIELPNRIEGLDKRKEKMLSQGQLKDDSDESDESLEE
jgi:hypothetical protein